MALFMVLSLEQLPFACIQMRSIKYEACFPVWLGMNMPQLVNLPETIINNQESSFSELLNLVARNQAYLF